MAYTSLDFIVNRNNLRDCRYVEQPLDTQPGDVVLAVDRFALTANNITYAAVGDAMGYWSFFPAEPGWGRIPVWGFADVIESQHDNIAVGERVYGYLPMSSHLQVRPARVTARGFFDGAAHRAERAPAYNQYTRLAADPAHDPAHEATRMLLQPLFLTSFILDDFITEFCASADNPSGARAVVLSSASSKTSLGLAFLLHANRAGNVRVIGLTSPANRAFVEKVGYYDTVVAYDALHTLDRDTPVVFVDMAGNGGVLRAVHEHFDAALRYSCLVGATHWEARGGAGRDTLRGPAPELFFAPTVLQKRTKEWGREGFDSRVASAWGAFVPAAQRWLKVVSESGPLHVETIYEQVLAGRAPPDTGYVLSLKR